MVKVSVVVIGRNEGIRLRACLESVFASPFPGDSREVIYVDSDSTDGSVDMARQLGARVISFTTGPFTAARGRNAGWRSARGEFVLFLDGDTVLDRSFIEGEIHRFADPNLAAVFGQRRESNPGASVYNRVLDFDWNPVPGPSLYFGGDTLVRRVCLEAVGGYREDLIAGEEPELCRRIRQRGWQIMHVDRLMTLHDLALRSWRQYWRRAFRTGHAYAQISSLSANTDDPLWVRESHLNAVRGLFWIGLPLFAIALSLYTESLIPLGAALLVTLTLTLRSAAKSSQKIRQLSTLLLYATHSHVQQVPILLGQLSFWTARVMRKQRNLIEYKEPA
jgi:cellulose synthase/poly-beta-1,6-N-acetylglucosamine synthase-like glycosyltransferase